ncbi:MAG: glycosyltransferase family 2 protein [Candidatus Omnitrophota bacterium]
MKLSVVIPAHNEEDCLERVTVNLIRVLKENNIIHEVLIVNDNSTDSSPRILEDLAVKHKEIRVIQSDPPKGFGKTIRKGLESISGDAVVIFMADGSDNPDDVVKYYLKILEGYDCVFGSRFIKGSKVVDYPRAKLFLNRLGNKFIQLLFLIKYNDISNAFKAYRREVLHAVHPLISQHFNITVELPLKAIVRGFSYTVIPINWNGRESGVSKYHIREIVRKYFFSIFFVWLEKILLAKDIRKP